MTTLELGNKYEVGRVQAGWKEAGRSKEDARQRWRLHAQGPTQAIEAVKVKYKPTPSRYYTNSIYENKKHLPSPLVIWLYVFKLAGHQKR